MMNSEKLAELIQRARHIVVLTGAGISTSAGIPDFRGPRGIYVTRQYDPEKTFDIQWFDRDPHYFFAFARDFLGTIDRIQPTRTHTFLAELEHQGSLKSLITQNIDGLHRAAGSQRVVEFHGSRDRYYCLGCGADHDPVRARGLTPAELPWRCASCGGVVRPAIVFFGEGIPEEAREEAFDLAGAADLVLVAGTSGEVAPANRIPLMVKHRGGAVVEINLGESAYDEVSDVRITARVEEALPLLARALIPGGWTVGNPGPA